MLKVLTLSLVLAASSFTFASERTSCVIQVLKNDTNAQHAHFVFACGSETIATHNTTPMNQLSSNEVTNLKAGYMQVLRNVVTGSNVNCFEHDSDLFWIGICHQQ